jgi:hypothetical protein
LAGASSWVFFLGVTLLISAFFGDTSSFSTFCFFTLGGFSAFFSSAFAFLKASFYASFSSRFF